MPTWRETIYLSDVWDDDPDGFEASRDEIVKRIKMSAWYRKRDADGFDELGMLVEDIATADNQGEFNEFWAALYDQADYNRIWIDLHSPVPAYLTGV